MWIYRNGKGQSWSSRSFQSMKKGNIQLKYRTELKRAPDQMDWQRPSGTKSKDNSKRKTEDFREELTQQNSAGISGQPEKGLQNEETI